METQEIKQRLYALSDEEYRIFSSRLAKSSLPMIGVRLPLLKKLAKEIADSDPVIGSDTMEELLLQGFVIGIQKLDVETRCAKLTALLDKTDNWSVCDSTCAAQKAIGKTPEKYLPFIDLCLRSGKPYFVRFGAVSLLAHYLTEAYIDGALARFAAVETEHDCVRMAVAWGYATALAKFPNQTLGVLSVKKPDSRTCKMLIGKARDSYRVSGELLARLKEILSKTSDNG